MTRKVNLASYLPESVSGDALQSLVVRLIAETGAKRIADHS